MKFSALSLFPLCLLSLVEAAALPTVVKSREVACYDAIVIGGGPAGLSALSGLARVRRKAILIDSGEYRNGATRHMHDVIGLDGVTPAYFRWLAREKLAYYDTVTMMNGTVASAQFINGSTPSFTAQVVYPSGEQVVLTARSIVLATGLRDIIPNTPGLPQNWAQGIYWCPWCDGHEHADQSLGILADLNDVPRLVREISTLNTDVVAFVNGTDTPAKRTATDAAFADWQSYLKINNVTIYNQTLTAITRLQDGSDPSESADLPTYPMYDRFRVDLNDGTSVERAAFFTNFPNEQRSTVAQDMGVTVQWGRLAGEPTKGYLTNLPKVYAVGDTTIANSTNVPHAMYSGKRAAVYLHAALGREDVAAEVAAGGTFTNADLTKREEQDIDPRDIWDKMNGPLGDLFYAGSFDGDEY